LTIKESIPEAKLLFWDTIICSTKNELQPGDIAVLPFGISGNRLLLCWIRELISAEDLIENKSSNDNNKPEALEHCFKWAPIAFGDETIDFFAQEFNDEGGLVEVMPMEFVVGTVLRMTRHLNF